MRVRFPLSPPPSRRRAAVPALLAALLSLGTIGLAAADGNPGAAREFVARFGPTWFEHLHDDIQSAYPFGRSNKANDAKIAKVFDVNTVSRDVALTDEHYLYDGDQYAVQWFYHATFVQTGAKQVECTLAFGRVQDGQLIEWREYFDDAVGELQAAGALPLYAPGEEPFPWPRQAQIRRPYRP